MKSIRNIFKKPSRIFVGFVDTSFVEGTFLKLIEKDHWRITIKDDRRLRELNEPNCLLLINDLNVYEIKNKLIKTFNIPFSKIDKLYDEGMRVFKNIKKIEPPVVKINNSLINWMLENNLQFRDGLLIDIAQKFNLPFITSEKNARAWKEAYVGVMSQKEFWDKLEKYRSN
tara:strand:- start:593 stop:1105 length:513 start_codon:yes stop_codon:yes gene_type:complete